MVAFPPIEPGAQVVQPDNSVIVSATTCFARPGCGVVILWGEWKTMGKP
jgi:hypothetical protein